MINIKRTNLLKIGADVVGSGSNLSMALYPEDGFGESWKCSFNPQKESGCIINTTSNGHIFKG